MQGFLMGVLKLFIVFITIYIAAFIYKYVTENGSLSDRKDKKYSCIKDDFPIPPLLLEKNPNTFTECVYCGGKIPGDEDICPYCDREKINSMFFTFQKEKIPEAEFIGRINDWLLHVQGIYDPECNFITRDIIAPFVPTGRLENITLFYKQKKGEGELYGIDIVDSFSAFKKDKDKLLSNWEQKHPSYEILKYDSHYYFWGRILPFILGGFGGANKTKIYILYKVKS